MKRHTIRKPGSFQNAIEVANNWINTNISVHRLVSISTIYCHYNDDCMITIYYNEGALTDGLNPNLVLRHQIIRNGTSWQTHYGIMDKKVTEINSTIGEVFTINELESPAPKF